MTNHRSLFDTGFHLPSRVNCRTASSAAPVACGTSASLMQLSGMSRISKKWESSRHSKLPAAGRSFEPSNPPRSLS